MSPWLRWLEAPARGRHAPTDVMGQLRRNAKLYAVGVVTLATQQFLMAQRDFLVKGAVDNLGGEALDSAASAALLILVVSIGAAVVRLVSRATVFAAGRNVEYDLRASLIERLHRLGPSFFARMATGEIMSRATNDLQQMRLLLGFGVLNIASTLFSLASALYVMIAVSPQLTLAAVSILPILALITRRFATHVFSRARESQAALGAMSDRVLASLAGVRVVRSFAMEDAELAAFERQNQHYLEKSLALAKVRGSMWPMMGAINATGVLIVFWYGGVLLATDPSFTPGAFVAFWLALLRLTWPMMAIGFVAGILSRGRASYLRLKELFDAEPDVVDGTLPAPDRIEGAIEVKGLCYAYRDRPVLEDVSFDVPAGSSLAILGRTGAGKSTLAALLSRLLPTAPGQVYLDGADVCALPLRTVRAAIGYAQQDAFLFSTTVADNIAFGLDDDAADALAADSFDAARGQRATRDVHHRIREAAAEAQVLDDVLALPEGFDTVVGERGVQLSGGQKQRIALARALVREPAVLVLDDPLSAVDARTEAAILEAIERQAARRTVVLVTHRVAAAQRCDRVLVLDRGRVMECGTHDELVGAGGLYALFAEEQRMEEALASPEDEVAE